MGPDRRSGASRVTVDALVLTYDRVVRFSVMRRRFRQTAWCLAGVLALLSFAAQAQEELRFTATADMRHEHTRFAETLDAVNALVGGIGAFHVTVGDEDSGIWDNRAVIDATAGPTALWFPIIGNHEAEDPLEMDWLRAEYAAGSGERIPLADLVSGVGPPGTEETTYSWDWGGAHFIAVNEYWNGTSEPGADVATDGDIVPELLAWMEADLRHTTRPVVFVLGHEPAFPFHRHLDDSLNKYESNRDAFWALLERESVVAYICGHTHVYSAYRHGGGRVWQIDVGNAGNDSSFLDGRTFLSVVVGAAEVRFEVCRDHDGPFACDVSWTETIPVIFKDGFESGDTGRW